MNMWFLYNFYHIIHTSLKPAFFHIHHDLLSIINAKRSASKMINTHKTHLKSYILCNWQGPSFLCIEMETLVIWHFILPNEQLRASFEKAVVISPLMCWTREPDWTRSLCEMTEEPVRRRPCDPPEGSSVVPSSGLKIMRGKKVDLFLCYSQPQNHIRMEQTVLPIVSETVCMIK